MFHNCNINMLVFLLISVLVASSCTSAKPIYQQKSQPDYNQRIQITKPEFQKKVNSVGVGVTVASATAGGFIGYNSSIIEFNDKDNNVSTNKFANAAIGAVAGFGVASLFNYVVGGKDKKVSLSGSDDVQKWVRKFDKSYVLIGEQTNLYKINLIRSDYVESFRIKNIADAEDFNKAFYLSNSTNNVVRKSYENLTRYELPSLLKVFPNLSSDLAYDIKLSYINQSESLDDYTKALTYYSGVKEDAAPEGMNRIRSIDDLKLFLSVFSLGYQQADLIRKSSNYVESAEEAVYFNETFPNNSYYSQLVEKVQANSSDRQLKYLIDNSPYCNCLSDLKKNYVLRSDDYKTLLDRNALYSILSLDRNYSLKSASSVEKLLTDLNVAEQSFGRNRVNSFKTNVREDYLSDIYRGYLTSDKGQQDFKRFIQDKNWLLPEADNYLRTADNQIYKNNKPRIDRENEVDDINKYADFHSRSIQEIEGEELSYWQQFTSMLVDQENRIVLVSGQVENFGTKPKEIRVKVTLNILQMKTSIWGDKNNNTPIVKYFFVTLSPGESKGILVPFEYQYKYKESSGMLDNSYIIAVNRDNPVEVELEYWNNSSVPQSVIEEQRKMMTKYKPTSRNNNSRRNSGRNSLHYELSNTHSVLSQSDKTSIEVKRLTSNSTSNGRVSINMDDKEDNSFTAQITTINGRTENYSGSEESVYDSFKPSDFPLTVSVSYMSEERKSIAAKVVLETYFDYRVNLKESIW